MDRRIVYPGAIPVDRDMLDPQINTMIAIGALIRATLGTATLADGLAIAQAAVPNLTVVIGPGSLTSMVTVDASAFGSVPTNAASLMKQAINLTSTTLACAAPVTSGHSINYLIQAAFVEADGVPVVLPYYNAANPSLPYTGPAGAGTPNNTSRVQAVLLQAKAGTSATTGSQTTPAADGGFVGLYVVTVAHGQTEITTGNLANARLPSAPFINVKLAALQPLNDVIQTYTSDATYTVPAGVTRIRRRVWGGGAGGGGNTTSGAAGGGGGGGYSEDVITVTPGQVLTVTVGAGGVGGVNNSGTAAGNDGGDGGATTIAGSGISTITGGGGTRGKGSVATGQGASGAGGVGSGGHINMTGAVGNSGQYIAAGNSFGGHGGGCAAGGGGGASSTGLATVGAFPGGGGAGGATNYAGEAGAGGLAVIEPIGRA